MTKALIEVLQERVDQDETWGDDHDDGHTPQDWYRFIRCRLDDFYADETPEARRRELMVHIAALAIAALEADDRKGLAMQTWAAWCAWCCCWTVTMQNGKCRRCGGLTGRTVLVR